MTLMIMHLNDPLPNLSSFRPDIPGSLIEVIEKALAKNPGQRYASMSEFAAALKKHAIWELSNQQIRQL